MQPTGHLGYFVTEQAGKPRKTIEEALAQRVEARRDAAFAGAEALHELGAVDRAVYEAIVGTPTPALDGPFRRLSNAAGHAASAFAFAYAVGRHLPRLAVPLGLLAGGVAYSRSTPACTTPATW